MSQGNKLLLTFHTDFSNEENGTDIFDKASRPTTKPWVSGAYTGPLAFVLNER